MIRKAKPSDVPEIVDLAYESVTQNPIPVNIDKDAMEETALICLEPSHFLWVSEIEGKVIAAVAANVTPSFWHQRSTCAVLLYYTRIPGEGVKLLREFSKWVKSRPGIKVATIEMEPETDPRMLSIMKRLGFTRESKNLTFVRGLQ